MQPMTQAARQQKFEQLVADYVDDLYRFGVWLTRDAGVAQDLVQETLLRAWRSMESLREANAVKSWLFTTLRRENARRFERKQLPLVDIDDHQPADSGGNAPDAELFNDELRAAIAALPARYREPLVLQVSFGCSIAEIAEQLGLSESATMTRVFRARKQLKQRLEETPVPSQPEGAPPLSAAA
jgi:RNA polymerase sigma-70 factor (ECF subfamily)